MEKIAIISDIHGNKTALEAVLADIKDRKIQEIYCLGDCVTKCPNPDVVVDLVRKNCSVVLLGNCDEIICSEKKKKYLNFVLILILFQIMAILLKKKKNP